MTRFARAEGSKSSNKKIPEEGTPWHLLKEGISKRNDTRKSNSDKEKQESKINKLEDSSKYTIYKGNTWSVIDEPVSSNKRKSDCENENSVKRRLTCVNASNWRSSDGNNTVLNNLKDNVEDESKDVGEIGAYKKNETKKSKKKDGKKCLKCRKSDHIYRDCPEKNESDICFICGSTEHKFRDCKQKRNSQDKFNFATCFICKEQGHISTSCPDNPSGLYPYGGGCHECGDVTHFSRDCPKKQKQSSKKQYTLPTLSNFDIEGLPEDKPSSPVVSKPKKVVKIVKF